MEIIKYNADIRLIHFPFLKKYQIQYGFSNWRDELSIDFDNFNNFDDANSRYEEFMKNKVVRECEELRIIRFKLKLNEYIYEIEQINEKGIWARVQLDGYSFAESWFMEEFNAIYYYEEVLKQMKEKRKNKKSAVAPQYNEKN